MKIFQTSRSRRLVLGAATFSSLWALGIDHSQAKEFPVSSCEVAQTGNPCQGNSTQPNLDLSVGNPVNLATGKKFQQEDDLPLRPSGIEFVRFYNSIPIEGTAGDGILGPKWRHSFSRRLSVSPLTDKPVTADTVYQASITTDDGAVIRFNSFKSGQPAQALDASQGTLTHDAHGNWEWKTPYGKTDRFDKHGYLTSVEEPGMPVVTIHYQTENPDASSQTAEETRLIDKITSAEGEELQLHYQNLAGHQRLTRVSSPVGNYYYEYDTDASQSKASPSSGTDDFGGALLPRLTTVRKPNDWTMTYGYQSDNRSRGQYLLSDIFYQAPGEKEPLHTNHWHYIFADGKPLADQSVMYNQDPSKTVHLEFQYLKTPQHDGDSGITVVKQPDDRTTQFQYLQLNQRLVLQGVSGDPCPACPRPGLEADYNSKGQLVRLNDTHFGQTRQGQIGFVSIPMKGWGGRLTVRYDEQGRPIDVHTPVTGHSFQSYNNRGLISRKTNAIGNTRAFQYDDNGLITRVQTGPLAGPPDMVVDFKKIGPNHIQLIDPQETQDFYKEENSNGYVQQVKRKWSDGEELVIKDRYTPDYKHRTLVHELPEGGKLSYKYGVDGKVSQITWIDRKNKEQTVYTRDSDNKQTFGNGIERTIQKNIYGQLAQTLITLTNDAGENLVTESKVTESGKVIAQQIQLANSEDFLTRRIQYDKKNNKIVYRGIAPQPISEYMGTHKWQDNGQNLLTTFESEMPASNDDLEHTDKPNEAGYYSQLDIFGLNYDSSSTLRSISVGGKIQGSYSYNGLGFRTSKVTASGETQFFYHDHQLQAEAFWNRKTGKPLITRRYIYDGLTPVGVIIYDKHPEGTLYFVHSDAIGQPYMITNQHRETQWLAWSFLFGSRYGAIDKIGGFHLTLPGQYFDMETGFVQNIYRYMDPFTGSYLEPDPLGPSEQTEAYAYADHEPQRYVDPRGLLLFAFDGTSNTPEVTTNPFKFSQLYDDGPTYYIPGPGTAAVAQLPMGVNSILNDHESINEWRYIPTPLDMAMKKLTEAPLGIYRNDSTAPSKVAPQSLDLLEANHTPYILNRQWFHLIQQVISNGAPDPSKKLNIDVTGFSRGAALSLIFGQRIAKYTDNGLFSYQPDWLHDKPIQTCINLRFMGVFDTVPQLGPLGSHNKFYDYQVDPAWKTVVHAVALNESRSYMPVTSLDQYSNVSERGFLGVHSDIGGAKFGDDEKAKYNPGWTARTKYGYKLHQQGDLYKIPFNWVYDQAVLTGVKMKPLSAYTDDKLDTIRNPILHIQGEKYSSLFKKVRKIQIVTPNGITSHKLSRDKKLDQLARTQTWQYVIPPGVKVTRNSDGKDSEFDVSPVYRKNFVSATDKEFLRVDAKPYVEYLEKELGWDSKLKFEYKSLFSEYY